MKKILFNDRYALTQAVLEGRKTQTRRIIKSNDAFERGDKEYWSAEDIRNWNNSFTSRVLNMSQADRDACLKYLVERPKYKLGEVVAVAQSYKDCGYDSDALDRSPKDFRIVRGTLGESKGWNNKMFVRADACKNRIRITNVRVERLQDISDSDCEAEGVYFHMDGYYSFPNSRMGYDTPREAYAALIDRISGKGVWESNPYVFVYDFELIKSEL